jgi:hypothetical protein
MKLFYKNKITKISINFLKEIINNNLNDRKKKFKNFK